MSGPGSESHHVIIQENSSIALFAVRLNATESRFANNLNGDFCNTIDQERTFQAMDEAAALAYCCATVNLV